MGDENNGEITCCVRWTPILVLVLSYVTAALMYYLSMTCYTTIDPENINHLLTGLWFLVLAGFIILLQNACCACRTVTGKLRLIRYAGFVAVILILVRFIDMYSRDIQNIPYPGADEILKLKQAKSPRNMLLPRLQTNEMLWEDEMTSINAMWKVVAYCTLVCSSFVPVWLLLVGDEKCSCCCGRKS